MTHPAFARRRPAVNRPRFTPEKLLFSFAFGMLLIALATHWHRARRVDFETTIALTALGDREFFVPEIPINLKKPVIYENGRAWFLVEAKRVARRDERMWRVSQPEDTYLFYRDLDGPDEDPLMYVKVAPGEYLRLKQGSVASAP
ncbi:MAG: hypothetical protein AAF514_09850 [Verrucomicrobiota bacterium]